MVNSYFYSVLTSIKSTQDFYTGVGLFELPKQFQWSNFTDAWNTGRLGLYMKNGLIVCFLKVPLGIVCSSLLAFALTRLSIPHSRAIFIFVLVGMMLSITKCINPSKYFIFQIEFNKYLFLFILFLYWIWYSTWNFNIQRIFQGNSQRTG